LNDPDPQEILRGRALAAVCTHFCTQEGAEARRTSIQLDTTGPPSRSQIGTIHHNLTHHDRWPNRALDPPFEGSSPSAPALSLISVWTAPVQGPGAFAATFCRHQILLARLGLALNSPHRFGHPPRWALRRASPNVTGAFGGPSASWARAAPSSTTSFSPNCPGALSGWHRFRRSLRTPLRRPSSGSPGNSSRLGLSGREMAP
jgi:hypothetical protein